MLTGYLGKPEIGEAALGALAKIRAARPDAAYACDPVIGDAGRGSYVAAGFAEFFRDRALPAATIATPNAFELECFDASDSKLSGVSRVAQRKRIEALAVAAAVWGLVQPALASCDADMQKLAQARNAELREVNDFAEAAHGKPLDPGAFCVKTAGLMYAEQALIDYMVKNKDRCSFPNTAIDNLKASHAKNAGFRAKACEVAVKIKNQKEQGEGGEPGPAAKGTIVIPLVPDGGTFAVPVTINGQITLKFVVDSGASDVSIPADVVLTLVRTGTITDADFLGTQTYRMADGSSVPSQRFVIRSLKVGDRTLENVTGSIAPIAGSLLLGQSFLSRFKSWSIDNQRRALILN